MRQTIKDRGSLRVVLMVVSLMGWASIVTVVVLVSPVPLHAVLPLAVLAAGFEAVYAIHVGVERIGRYVQVFFEETPVRDAPGEPSWETVAMISAPAVSGGGVDPLFCALFGVATVANFAVALLPDATALEMTVVAAPHLALIVRILRAHAAAAGQRTRDLAHFRQVKASTGPDPA